MLKIGEHAKTIEKELKKGNPITVENLGRFKTVKLPSQKGTFKPKKKTFKRIYFRPAKSLKNRINDR